jgi:glyoxylase-like metal-dependent hydrolase (beta-lactamase superfamily II)
MSESRAVPPLAGHRLERDPLSGGAAAELAVGDRTVIAVSDGFFSLEKAPTFLGTPAHPEAGREALHAEHGEARLPIGAFLVPGDPHVLIDAGVGPVDALGRGMLVGGNLLRALAAHGVQPADIGVIGLSHLHLDHVGWLADAEGAPVFPNAQVCVGRADWAFFVERDDAPVSLPPHIEAALVATAEAGRLTLLDDDRQIAPGVTRIAAPGHTPGHSLYAIHDRGERALVLGDAMYCPQQLTAADWAAASDVDPKLARRTREAFLRDLDEQGGLGIGCHFPGLRAGRVLGGAWAPA